MWLIRMAWKNMWRNRHRTVITMSAIFFAVILSVLTSSLKTGIFDNLVKNVVSFYSGYIQIHKEGYWAEQILDNSFEATGNLRSSIESNPGVVGFTPRIESFSLASSQDLTKGSLTVGIDPETEDKVTSLRSKLIHGEYLNDSDHSVLLSQGLAKRLRLNVNDTIVLITQGFHGTTSAGKYRIKGILKFGSPQLNDQALFMPLVLAQQYLNADGMITSYVLKINNPNKIQLISETIRRTIGKKYEVLTWEQMLPEIKQHIVTDSNNMRIIQMILYLIITFGIFGTLLMMMQERKYEMGMLIALGMQKIRLSAMLVAESVFTVISGSLLGIAVSIPLVIYLHQKPIQLGGETAKIYERFGFEPVFPTSVSINIFLSQALIVLMIGLSLSLYPIYKTIRLNPVKAMKN